MPKQYWVYVLLCSNNSFYTGYTVDLSKRYRSHVIGSGRCKYTMRFKPLKLLQCWEVEGNKALAMQVERAIKKLSRGEKELLLRHPSSLCLRYPVKVISKEGQAVLVNEKAAIAPSPAL